jgi:hypothetical protein
MDERLEITLSSTEAILCQLLGLALCLMIYRWWFQRNKRRKRCESVDTECGGDAGSWEGHSSFQDHASEGGAEGESH